MVRVAHSPPSPMETRTPAAALTNTRHKRKLRAYLERVAAKRTELSQSRSALMQAESATLELYRRRKEH